MKTLEKLVSEQTGNAAEIAKILNAKTVERTNREMQSYRAITSLHGPTFAATILGKLDAASASNPLLKATYNAVCNGGIDFASNVTQGMIDQLTGKLFTPEEAAKLKALGVWQISPCEANGLTEATEETVQTAIDFLAKDMRRNHAEGVMHGIGMTFSLNPNTTMVEAVNQFARGVLTAEQADAVAKVLEG